MNQPGEIPTTVKGDFARDLYADTNAARREIKETAARVDGMRAAIGQKMRDQAGDDTTRLSPEVIANTTLAFRHLEDASMRLGKTLQALDGGVSVYDRSTTVGAPDGTEVPVRNVAELSPSRID